MSRDEQTKVIVDYHAPEGPIATQVRSTLLSSSLQTLRELGYFERYVALIAPAERDVILYTLAPTWLPMQIAEAHYAACEALQLSASEMGYVGSAVAKRFMGTFLQTFVRSSRSVGGSPWVPIHQYGRLWSRIWQGGSVLITERGPKDAVIESRGLSVVGGRYFSNAYMGVIRAAGLMFASTVYVKAIRTGAPLTHICNVSWV